MKRFLGVALLVWMTTTAMADEVVPAWRLLSEASTLKFIFTQAGTDESGEFEEFQADFRFDPQQLSQSRFDVRVKMGSVNTGDADRDEILQSEDMFAVQHWPEAHFITTNITHKGGDEYFADAELTIRDQTRKIPFPFSLKIDLPEKPDGKAEFHLQADVVLNRLEYGVGKGDWAETTWISDPVRVKVDVRAVQQQ